MSPLRQMVSITELKNHDSKVFAMLDLGPVVVATHDKPTAVIISPEQWDAMVKEMEMLWAEREAALAELRLATGRSKVVEMNDQAITEWLAEEPDFLHDSDEGRNHDHQPHHP